MKSPFKQTFFQCKVESQPGVPSTCLLRKVPSCAIHYCFLLNIAEMELHGNNSTPNLLPTSLWRRSSERKLLRHVRDTPRQAFYQSISFWDVKSFKNVVVMNKKWSEKAHLLPWAYLPSKSSNPFTSRFICIWIQMKGIRFTRQVTWICGGALHENTPN